MTKYITPTLFAVLTTASINCATPQQAANPVPPDCSSLNLQEKIGFSTEFGPEEKKVCYEIQSGAGQSFEYIGLCKPVKGTLEFYRNFAGVNKGGMEMNFISNLMGVPAYVHFSRSPLGEINLYGSEISKEEIEQEFQRGAKILDSIKNIPEVCKELHDYKKK